MQWSPTFLAWQPSLAGACEWQVHMHACAQLHLYECQAHIPSIRTNGALHANSRHLRLCAKLQSRADGECLCLHMKLHLHKECSLAREHKRPTFVRVELHPCMLAHLSCDPVSNMPWPNIGPKPRDWGPLIYCIDFRMHLLKIEMLALQ